MKLLRSFAKFTVFTFLGFVLGFAAHSGTVPVAVNSVPSVPAVEQVQGVSTTSSQLTHPSNSIAPILIATPSPTLKPTKAPTPKPTIKPTVEPTLIPNLAPAAPSDATAICSDGTYSYSQHRQGTCSHHGGVAQWL